MASIKSICSNVEIKSEIDISVNIAERMTIKKQQGKIISFSEFVHRKRNISALFYMMHCSVKFSISL